MPIIIHIHHFHLVTITLIFFSFGIYSRMHTKSLYPKNGHRQHVFIRIEWFIGTAEFGFAFHLGNMHH